MDSGAIRQDISRTQNFTPGEARTLRWTLFNEAGQQISNFGNRTFRWFLLERLSDAQGLDELEASAVRKLTPTTSAPFIDLSLVPTDTKGLPVKTWAAELWRTDEGNVRRVWYGLWQWTS